MTDQFYSKDGAYFLNPDHRQKGEKNMPDKYEIQWTCPFCQTSNIDYYDITATPHCSSCENTIDWNDFLSMADFQKYNDMLKADGYTA